MSTSGAVGRQGPGGRPIRLYVPPASLGGKLRGWRFLIMRRVLQFGTLVLFFGTVHWGWSVSGRPLLAGNLSGSEILGLIPMADPFAVLQMWFTRHVLEPQVLIGAGLVLLIYAILGGRTWCAWVCPINPVTDLAGWLRRHLPVKDTLHLSRHLRYTVLVLALVLSALTGLAAFEWVSPISMLHREVVFGVGLGWTAVLGIFLFDLFVLRHGWCGHVCPLGAFYGVVGKVAQVRVRFDDTTCTHCGECIRICPEPQVLNLKLAALNGMVISGECSNCARCIPICPEGSLSFDWRHHIVPGATTNHNEQPIEDPRRRAV